MTDQFVFVEQLGQLSRDELVEALKEAVNLRPDGMSHAQLRDELDVLLLK